MTKFSTKNISITNFIFITLLFGFSGGCLGFFFIQFSLNIFSRALPLPSDAISIANTYIVFTTFIFTGLAIFLALATYYFSVQQAKTRKHLESELLEKILIQCQENKEIGVEVITHLIKNQEAINHFEEVHGEKIKEIANSYMEQYLSIVKAQQNNSVSLPSRIDNLKGKVKKAPTESDKMSNPPTVEDKHEECSNWFKKLLHSRNSK